MMQLGDFLYLLYQFVRHGDWGIEYAVASEVFHILS